MTEKDCFAEVSTSSLPLPLFRVPYFIFSPLFILLLQDFRALSLKFKTTTLYEASFDELNKPCYSTHTFSAFDTYTPLAFSLSRALFSPSFVQAGRKKAERNRSRIKQQATSGRLKGAQMFKMAMEDNLGWQLISLIKLLKDFPGWFD